MCQLVSDGVRVDVRVCSLGVSGACSGGGAVEGSCEGLDRAIVPFAE